MLRELDTKEMEMVSGGLWIQLDHIDANVTGTSLVADGVAGYNHGGVDHYTTVEENSLWQILAAYAPQSNEERFWNAVTEINQANNTEAVDNNNSTADDDSTLGYEFLQELLPLED